MKHAAAITVVLSLAVAAASAVFAPQEWRWPAIGAALFIGIFVGTRALSAAIGRGLEKKFNGKD